MDQVTAQKCQADDGGPGRVGRKGAAERQRQRQTGQTDVAVVDAEPKREIPHGGGGVAEDLDPQDESSGYRDDLDRDCEQYKEQQRVEVPEHVEVHYGCGRSGGKCGPRIANSSIKHGSTGINQIIEHQILNTEHRTLNTEH